MRIEGEKSVVRARVRGGFGGVGKITYNVNGGSGTMAQQSFTYGGSVKLKNPTFIKDGKEFDHWNTMANNTGESYNAGQTVTLSKENFTLYAQWKDATATLSITGNHGLTKIRVYDKYDNYHDYTSFDAVAVYPGKDVILYHDAGTEWVCQYADNNKLSDSSTRVSMGVGTAFYVTVQDDASGASELKIVHASTGGGYIPSEDGYSQYSDSVPVDMISFKESTSWAQDLSNDFIMLCLSGSLNKLLSAQVSTYIWDKYGNKRQATFSNKWIRVDRGCQVLFRLGSYWVNNGGTPDWICYPKTYPSSGDGYSLGKDQYCRFIIPDDAFGEDAVYGHYEVRTTGASEIKVYFTDKTVSIVQHAKTWARNIVMEIGQG